MGSSHTKDTHLSFISSRINKTNKKIVMMDEDIKRLQEKIHILENKLLSLIIEIG